MGVSATIGKSSTCPFPVAPTKHSVPITHSPRATKNYSAKVPPKTTLAIPIMTETNGSCSTRDAAPFPLEVEAEVEDGEELDALVDVAVLVVRLDVPFVEDVAEN